MSIHTAGRSALPAGISGRNSSSVKFRKTQFRIIFLDKGAKML
jgi:hypothetical protein